MSVLRSYNSAESSSAEIQFPAAPLRLYICCAFVVHLFVGGAVLVIVTSRAARAMKIFDFVTSSEGCDKNVSRGVTWAARSRFAGRYETLLVRALVHG